MKGSGQRRRGARQRMGATLPAMATIGFIALAGCAPQPQVHVNAMTAPAANFAALSTWAWAPNAGEPVAQSVAGQYISSAIASQLAAKGYRQVQGGNPDFLMDYRVVLRPEASLEGFGGGSPGGGTLQTIHYTRGMLLASATSPVTGNALWQAVASTVIEPDSVGSQDAERINSAVAKMLESFPAH